MNISQVSGNLEQQPVLEQQLVIDRIMLLAEEMGRQRERLVLLADCVLRDKFGVGQNKWADLKQAFGYNRQSQKQKGGLKPFGPPPTEPPTDAGNPTVTK